MSYPALLALSYQLSRQAGGQTYSILELIGSAGIFAGSILISRLRAIGTLRAVGAGLLLTGVFSVAVSFSSTLALIAIALFVGSIGNSIYAIANQTALVEAADSDNRGSVMATRFGLVQTAIMIGAGLGGVITNYTSPRTAFGVLGVGLVILAMYAIAAGRSTTNPLHGSAYEEAARHPATGDGYGNGHRPFNGAVTPGTGAGQAPNKTNSDGEGHEPSQVAGEEVPDELDRA